MPGGGVALVRCIEAVKKLKLKGDEKTGADILAHALAMPCYCIAANAGVSPNLVVSKVAEGKGGFGYNAFSDQYEDLLEAGVIDPVKVTRSALQNAVSIAGLLMTIDWKNNYETISLRGILQMAILFLVLMRRRLGTIG